MYWLQFNQNKSNTCREILLLPLLFSTKLLFFQKYLVMWVQTLLIMLLTLKWQTLAIKYKANDEIANGLRISLNNNFTIAAFNGFHEYILRFLSQSRDMECRIHYRHKDFYVYSLSALTMKPDSTVFSFVQIGEYMTSNDVVLSVVTSDISSCNTDTRPKMLEHTVWMNGHQQHILLKTDPDEKYAYVFAESFVFSYDLSSNQIVQMFNSTFFTTSEGIFIPTDVSLTNEWAVVMGYYSSKRFGFDLGAIYPIRLRPQMLSVCHHVNGSNELELKIHFLKSGEVHFNKEYGAPISIDPSGSLLAIGGVEKNRVSIIKMSDVQSCMANDGPVTRIRLKSSSNIRDIGFGSSVAWLDAQGTLAVLAQKSSRQTWSDSEIYVLKNIPKNSTYAEVQPDFLLPNNQQTFSSLSKTSFVRIVAHANNLLVLRDDHKYLYIPFTDKGSIPVLIEKYASNLSVFIFDYIFNLFSKFEVTS